MPGGSPAIVAAVFRAVRTGNAFEETVERLLEGVKLGVYAPGDRLPPERELTRRLGVSRITLREALRELAAAGYVETKRGRFGGTFIIRQPEPLVPDELTRTARDEGAAEPAALGLDVAGRGQFAQRLPQRDPADPEPAGEFPLRGQPVTGRVDAQLDAFEQPLDRLLEGISRPHRAEHRGYDGGRPSRHT